jgi:hypothetical protein
MMRSFDYARTPPEAPAGSVVFAARLVIVIMAPAYAGDFDWRQRLFGPKNRPTEVELDVVVTP